MYGVCVHTRNIGHFIIFLIPRLGPTATAVVHAHITIICIVRRQREIGDGEADCSAVVMKENNKSNRSNRFRLVSTLAQSAYRREQPLHSDFQRNLEAFG